MIIGRTAAGLSVVLQVDHQEQCAAAARAWGNAAFARLEPWEPIVRAAAVHDEGWRTWEGAPEIDDAGRPVDFPQIDRGRHIALYRGGIAAAYAEGPLIGLLVSMHGEGLYRSRPGVDGPGGSGENLSDAGRAFADEQRDHQARTLSSLGEEAWSEWATRAQRLIQTWDALSLYLTWRGLPDGREGRLRAVPVGPEGPCVELALRPRDELTVACDPYPFAASPATLPVTVRTIPDRLYANHADLRRALAAAAVEQSAYRVVRAT
jgi:hypothetical protein